MLRSIFSIILIVNISFGGAYVIKPTEVVNEPLLTAFDSDGNTFVLERSYPYCHLHKMTSTNELAWTLSLTQLETLGLAPKMVVTNQNDLYLRYASDDGPVTYLYSVRSNTSDLIEIDHVAVECQLFILDDNDNLFYCGANYDIRILRSNSTNPTTIENLDGLIVYRGKSVTVDKEGNVYFAASKFLDSDEFLALLTKEEIESEVPKAQLMNVFHDKDKTLKLYISSLFVDEKNYLWLFITDLTTLSGYVKKYKDGVLKTIYVDNPRGYVQGLLAGDRIYVMTETEKISSNSNICYVTANDDVVKISGLTNITVDLSDIKAIVDKNENAYFAIGEDFTPELGSFVVINADQEDPIPLQFDDSKYTHVRKMRADLNETIWIIGDDSVYVLEKGETIAKKIPNFSNICSDVSFNPVTKEVYILCYKGLYHVIDE